MSVESYATLLNLKLVVPSAKSNYVAVDRNFWTHSFGCQIAEIALDQRWYCDRYSDVAEAVRSGALNDAKQHYRESGYFEHRLPYLITVNERWYLSQYDDVGVAIDKRIYSSAQDHFEQLGFKEGRLPYPGFTLTKGREVHR